MAIPAHQTPEPTLVVQQIHTVWTKLSRGGRAADQRNRVPDRVQIAMGLPSEVYLESLVQLVTYEESSGFATARNELWLNGAGPDHYGCVTVTRTALAAAATYSYDWKWGGAPERDRLKKTLLVNAGSWVQFVSNGRFAWGGGWSYAKDVVNVGMFFGVNGNEFTDTTPSGRFDATGILW